MRGGLDKLQVRTPEQPGQMACELGVEVAVRRTEHERDGQVEGRQAPSGDMGILLIERGKQGRSPGADSGQRVRTVNSAWTVPSCSSRAIRSRSSSVSSRCT
jgi:hypothetical protein